MIHFMGVNMYDFHYKVYRDKLYNGETWKSEQLNSFFLHYGIAPGSMITVLKAVRLMRVNRIWMHLIVI